jgi:hypothetical protein
MVGLPLATDQFADMGRAKVSDVTINRDCIMGFSPFLFSGFYTCIPQIGSTCLTILYVQRMNIGRQLSWDTLNTTNLVQTIKEAFRDPQMKR